MTLTFNPHRIANALAQLLTVPPYAVATVVLTGTAYISDRLQSRGFFMVTSSTVGGIGYLSVFYIEIFARVVVDEEKGFCSQCLTINMSVILPRSVFAAERTQRLVSSSHGVRMDFNFLNCTPINLFRTFSLA